MVGSVRTTTSQVLARKPITIPSVRAVTCRNPLRNRSSRIKGTSPLERGPGSRAPRRSSRTAPNPRKDCQCGRFRGVRQACHRWPHLRYAVAPSREGSPHGARWHLARGVPRSLAQATHSRPHRGRPSSSFSFLVGGGPTMARARGSCLGPFNLPKCLFVPFCATPLPVFFSPPHEVLLDLGCPAPEAADGDPMLPCDLPEPRLDTALQWCRRAQEDPHLLLQARRRNRNEGCDRLFVTSATGCRLPVRICRVAPDTDACLGGPGSRPACT